MIRLLTTINGKIILALLCIVIGVLSSFEYYQFRQKQQSQQQELMELANRITDRLAENLEIPLWELDEHWVKRVLHTEMEDKQVFAIRVYGENDEQTTIAGLQRDAQWQIVDSLKSAPFDQSLIIRYQPVYHQEAAIGSVRVYLSRKFLLQNFQDEMYRHLIRSILVGILIVVSLLIIMHIILISPLQSILHVVKRVARGDYSQDAPVKYQDEIGSVAKSFNALKQSVQQREQALSQSEEKIRFLLDSTAEGVFGLNTAGQCTFANTRCVTMLGYRNEASLIEQTIHPLIQHSTANGEPYPADHSVMLHALQTGQQIHNEDEVFWRADGSHFFVSYTLVPLLEKKEIVGAVVSFSDISEKRQAEQTIQTLVASTARGIGTAFYQRAVENLYHWLDADVVILSELNPHDQAVALAMMKDGRYIPDYHHAIAGTPCESVAQGEFTYYADDTMALFPQDADLAAMNIQCYIGIPIVNDEQHTMGVLCAMSRQKNKFPPQTVEVMKILAARASVELERRKLEDQFHQAQKMEALGTLVGGIAHDFNNILAGITGNLYLARMTAEQPPAVIEKMDAIEQLSYRAADMIKQLLAFARKGNVDIQPT